MMQTPAPSAAASVIAVVDAIAAHPDRAHSVSAFKSALRNGFEAAAEGGLAVLDTPMDEVAEADLSRADARTSILRGAWVELLPDSEGRRS
jgi:hypothetical protein